MPAVSNTSPVFNLACIGRLTLLHQQFGNVWIPRAVETELHQMPDATVRKTVHQAQQAGWLIVRPVTDANLVSLLTVELHQGEAEAIALALEMKVPRLLIDEKEGRAVARHLGVPVTGVLGVLLRGKMMGQVNAIKPEIEALRTQARFLIAADLEAAILETAGE
jgi:hypothetical protein